MQTQNVQNPQKPKNKILMVVLGLVAVAVIGAVTYLGTTGEWFKGHSDGASGGTLNLYVGKQKGSCDLPQFDPGYELGCRLTSITEAVLEAYRFKNRNYSFVNINIGNGIYNESGTITLKDKVFTIKGSQSKINGNLSFVFEIGGGISGLEFINFSNVTTSVIKGNFVFTGGNSLEINNIIIKNAIAKELISIIGGNNNNSVEIVNSEFFQSKANNIIHATNNIDLGIRNSVFYSNVVVGRGGLIYADKFVNVINCLFAKSTSANSVISLTSGDLSSILNNTFAENSTNGAVIFIPGSGGSKVINNLIVGSSKSLLLSNSVEVLTNAYDGTYAYADIYKDVNPPCNAEFVGGTTGDVATRYQLKSTSTCKDIGTKLAGITTDFFGNVRPQTTGGKYDIGFYEAPFVLAIPQGGFINPDLDYSRLGLMTTTTEPVCGNDEVETGEECDDGNTDDGDGCSKYCEVEDKWTCDDSEPSDCSKVPPTSSTTEVDCEDGWLDVDDSDVMLPYIIDMCEAGFIKGNADGKFYPDNPLTKAELIVIVLRNMGLEEDVDETDADCFSDMSEHEWYAPYVCLAKEKGIVSGNISGDIGAGYPVILAEADKMFLIAYGYDISFDDSKCWFCEGMELADKEGLLPFKGDIDVMAGKIVTRRNAVNLNWRFWDAGFQD